MIAMIQSLVSGFLEEGFTLDQMIVLSAKKTVRFALQPSGKLVVGR